MYERLLKVIGNLGTPRILVVGDFMLDVYVYGDAVRISPEAPVPVLKVTETESRCGGAASVAADLAALGAVPVCIGVVGEDASGRALRDRLIACGADVDNLLALPGRPTTTKQRVVGLAQHRHRQQLMRIDQEAAEPLPPEIVGQILPRYRERLADVDVVCFQDYRKGLITSSLCQQMIGLAQTAGRKVLVDPAFGRDYAQYSGATVLTPNRREAGAAVGWEIQTLDEAGRAAEHLRGDLGLEAAVITLDKEGAYLAADGVSELVPAKARTVYDVTGAGDVVLATLAVSLAADSDYLTAVDLANIAGGIEVEKFGAATVTVSEMIHEIAEQFGTANPKVRPLDWLLEEIKWRRQRGQTIVFTNGCFDVLHRGHIEYLQFCRDQGDVIIVGLNSDRSVHELKGPDRPINNERDRAAVLAGLASVDFITVFDDPSVRSLVEAVRPDVLVKGGDWGGKEGVVGYDVVEAYGGKVVLAPLVKDKSSTATIEKIRAVRNQA
jgi:D-beta-D-heptose 7-phosphate kinase/D-beta-D-heptose 1-phosphate adenosyltransferase